MANEPKLVVALEAKVRDFERQMAKAERNFAKNMDGIAKSSLRAESQVLRSSTVMNRALGALGGVAFVRQLQQMADAWTDMSSRVGLAVGSMDLAPKVMERIYDMAQRTYSSLDQTAEAFLGNATALRELGYSTNQQLDYTEALNNALVVSGAKAERAASVNNALSKAMAAGKLSGDNLNTVIETGGRVAELLAAKLGVSTNQLRKLGKDGKITSQVIYDALAGSLGKLREEAESMPATISDGFLKIGNALTKFVGTMDQASGVSATIAQGLVFVADNFESVAAGAAAAAAVMLGRYVPALVRVAASQALVVASNPFLLLVSAIGAAAFALSAFGGEIHPVAGELATLHDYAGAVWDTFTDGVSVAAGAIKDTMLGAINLMISAMDGVEVSWSDVLAFIKDASNKIIGYYVAIYETAVTTFTKLPAAVADGVVSAMNTMIGYVEAGINKVVDAVNTAIKAINSLGEWAGVSGVGTIDTVQLGRVTNAYAGAGAAAGKAYVDGIKGAFEKDYLGDGFEALRRRANERAAAKANESDGTGGALDVRGPRMASGDGGGGGSKGRGKKDEWQREIEKIRERTAALQAETAAQAQVNPLIDDYDYAMTKARTTQELLNAAQKAGLAITPELRAKIDELAGGYAQATVAANQLQEAQDNARKAADDFKGMAKDALGGFISDLRQGKSAAEALGNALDRITDKLIDMAMNSLFDGLFSGFGGFGGGMPNTAGFVPGLFSKGGPVHAATGGRISGPGSGTSDSIPAMLSDGEFVVNAAATKRNRALLEAINNGGALHLATGGFVGRSRGGSSLSGPAVKVNIINNAPATVSQKERQTSQGPQIDVVIDEVVAGKINQPGSRSRVAMQGQYGLKGGLARR